MLFSSIIYAETSMNMIATIRLPDTLMIHTSLPIGDYNADGYGDFLITAYRSVYPSYYYETAFLYYGGPQFDTIPDLIFRGQHLSPTEATGYGKVAAQLGDFNGDGYDDFAIGAPFYNNDIGKIYVYYGGPSPDTTADFEVYGYNTYDELPYLDMMIGGDYNGDGLGDILAVANNVVYGPKVFIYLGGNPPDTLPGIIYDYAGRMVEIGDAYGGSDINGDGYDDYGWRYWENGYHTLIFLGNSTLSQQPTIDSLIYGIYFFNYDISGDGVDDLSRSISGLGRFLCLGGNPLDIQPDYGIGRLFINSFPINFHELGIKIISDMGDYNHELILFNTGVPFDTVPIATFSYGYHHEVCKFGLGDINSDSTDEIALPFNDSIYGPHVEIYQIIYSSINDPIVPPAENELLSCYPNPFNSSTIIRYPDNEEGEIGIYNILGQQVKALRVSLQGGQIVWDGTDNQNISVPSGVYFARVKASENSIGAKLLLLR